MEAATKTIDLFTTRVRQMMLQYASVKSQNAELRQQVAACQAQVEQLEAKLRQAESDYNSLKMARMLEVTDGDMLSAQKRLAKLIRDVDKCITLVSEKQ